MPKKKNKRFARLFEEGIVAYMAEWERRHNTKSQRGVIELEIAAEISVSQRTLQYWRAGVVPKRYQDLKRAAEVLVKRAPEKLDKDWVISLIRGTYIHSRIEEFSSLPETISHSSDRETVEKLNVRDLLLQEELHAAIIASVGSGKTMLWPGLFSSPIMSLRAVPDGEAIPTLPAGDCFVRFASSQ
jgi:hypothetical protein